MAENYYYIASQVMPIGGKQGQMLFVCRKIFNCNYVLATLTFPSDEIVDLYINALGKSIVLYEIGHGLFVQWHNHGGHGPSHPGKLG